MNILNIQLAARELSWQPTISLVQGVERMLAAGKHKNT
jgi:nucleoside-diphosphate-sugar epimerase